MQSERNLGEPRNVAETPHEALGGNSRGDDRDEHEDNDKGDGDAEEQLINAAPRLEDCPCAAEDAAKARPTRLEQDGNDQRDAHDDLNDLKVLTVWCQKTHVLGLISPDSVRRCYGCALFGARHSRL